MVSPSLQSFSWVALKWCPQHPPASCGVTQILFWSFWEWLMPGSCPVMELSDRDSRKESSCSSSSSDPPAEVTHVEDLGALLG